MAPDLSANRAELESAILPADERRAGRGRSIMPCTSRPMAQQPGFGKLASVKIGEEELWRRSSAHRADHSAGTGATPRPPPSSGLMMALKLAILAQARRGVKPGDDRAA